MERWGRLAGMLFQIELLLILVAGSLAAYRLDDRMLLATEAVGAIAWFAMAWAQQRPDGSRFAEWRGTLQFAGLVSQTPHFVLAIAGGTGRYQRAAGRVAFDFPGNRQLVTVTLKR